MNYNKNYPNLNHLLPPTLGFLIALFMATTPWNRMWAEYIWVALFILSLFFISKNKPAVHQPERLIKLFKIFIMIFITSLMSFYFSPLENLPINSLEPDLRWILFIPITYACYKAQLNHNWVLFALCIYCLSAFIKGVVETDFGSNLNIRVKGDENANPFGMYNAMITLMLAGYFQVLFKTLSLTQRVAIVSFATLGIISTLLTGTRTAIFTLAIGGVILLYITIRPKKVALITTSTIIITTLIIANSTIKSTTIKRINHIPKNVIAFFNHHETKNSTGQRLEQWRGSICVFKKHPAFGSGPRSAKEAFTKYGGENDCNLQLTVKEGPRQTHSIYFNTLLTLGVTGILVFTYLFLHLIKIAKESILSNIVTHRAGSIVLIMFITGILINGIGLDMWFRNYMINKNLIALLLAIILLFKIEEPNTNQRRPKKCPIK